MALKIEFVLRDAIGRDWQCGTSASRFKFTWST